MEGAGATARVVTALAVEAPDADAARRDAARILSDDRFQPNDVPRPFGGVFDWIGDRLEPLGDVLERIGDAFEAVGDAVPGGVGVLVAGLAVVGFALALFATGTLVSRRARAAGSGNGRSPAVGDDPGALERVARDAERRGDFDAAVRLRFRAGLLRVAETRAIEWRPSLTSNGVARAIRSPAFEELATAFDAIAYGGRRARATDAETARAKWQQVLEEARAR